MPEPVLGLDFEVQASATLAGTYTLIDGLTSFRRNRNRPTQSTGIFGRTQKATTSGQREVTFSLGGVAIPGDVGQELLRTAESSNGTVFIKVVYAADGDSYTQEVRVGGGEHSVDDPDGLQTISFELTPVGDPTPGSGAVVL